MARKRGTMRTVPSSQQAFSITTTSLSVSCPKCQAAPYERCRDLRRDCPACDPIAPHMERRRVWHANHREA